MRKWLVLALLLVPIFHGMSQQQVDASSHLILATGTAAQADTKISNRPGTAFFDFGVDMTAWVGEMIEIKDATGYVMAGIISTVGTGETLGSELCSGATPWSATTSPPEYYYDTFESSNATTITSAITNDAEVYPGSGCTALVTLYNGGCFKLSGTLDLNSGGAPYFGCGTLGADCPRSTLANGATTGYTFVRYGVNASAALGNDSGATDWSMADISIKQLTAPSSTGHWIVAAPGSATKNWAYFDPLFMSGPYTWRIISKNNLGSSDDVFVASGSVTAANTTLSYTSGKAFVDFSTSFSLADHIGKKIVVTDSTGKTAIGYIKEAGTEETYTELLTNPTFDTNINGWNPINCTVASVAGGQSNNCAELTRTGGTVQDIYLELTTYSGRAVSASAYVKSGSSGNESFYLAINTSGNPTAPYTSGTSSSSWVKTSEVRATFTSYMIFVLAKSSSTAGTMLFDEASLKGIDAPSATGVTIVSTPGGSTYNWTSVTTGFYPSTGTNTFKIYTPMSGTVTSSDVHLVTDDGNASITVTGLDLSGFAGNDSGGTKTIINEYASDAATITTQPYLLTFYDSSGRQARGYAGAAYNTTGVKLFSTRSGTTQNLAGSDAGFDKAAVTKWKAYRTY